MNRQEHALIGNSGWKRKAAMQLLSKELRSVSDKISLIYTKYTNLHQLATT